VEAAGVGRMSTSRPHLAFPPRLVNGLPAVVEQDSLEHVEQRVLMVLSVVRGSLIDMPAFGIPDQAFTRAGTGLSEIRAAVDQWVPAARASVTDGALVNLARRVGVTINAQGGT
jgi:hypothetical protein